MISMRRRTSTALLAASPLLVGQGVYGDRSDIVVPSPVVGDLNKSQRDLIGLVGCKDALDVVFIEIGGEAVAA